MTLPLSLYKIFNVKDTLYDNSSYEDDMNILYNDLNINKFSNLKTNRFIYNFFNNSIMSFLDKYEIVYCVNILKKYHSYLQSSILTGNDDLGYNLPDRLVINYKIYDYSSFDLIKIRHSEQTSQYYKFCLEKFINTDNVYNSILDHINFNVETSAYPRLLLRSSIELFSLTVPSSKYGNVTLYTNQNNSYYNYNEYFIEKYPFRFILLQFHDINLGKNNTYHIFNSSYLSQQFPGFSVNPNLELYRPLLSSMASLCARSSEKISYT